MALCCRWTHCLHGLSLGDCDIVFEDLIQRALLEDLGGAQDWTSTLLLDTPRLGSAGVIARSAGILAGLAAAKAVFAQVDPDLSVKVRLSDGERFQAQERVLDIQGSLGSILTAERTALNFLQHLSGIATITDQFVQQVQGTGATILDTRKTTPGLRELEKSAVRAGGGENHRFGLHDMILIKENHIQAAGSIPSAVNKIRAGLAENQLTLRIEVEVTTLAEVQTVLPLTVDRIMLDNMTVSEIAEAVQIVAGRSETEVSGGVTRATVRELALTGVDFISVGALTHSAPAADFSLLVD